MKLPDKTRIGSVELNVKDLSRELSFYEGILGFKHRGNGDLGIVKLVEDRAARPRPHGASGLYHQAILLPTRGDLGRVISHLVKARYPLDGASDHGVSEALYLADPEGNGIEIYADRARETWTRLGERIQMGVQPMDVESVIGEGGDQPWSGIPDGTIMGHVHLNVSDVQKAASFYRDGLGFEIMADLGDSASFLSAGGYHHHIGINAWGTRGGPSAVPSTLGLRQFSIVVPDHAAVIKAGAQLKAWGADVVELRDSVVTHDPSGNEIVITAV